MNTPRPWPPPPRGAFVLAERERRLCESLEALALLHVIAGLAWPLLVVGTTWLDPWLPDIAVNRYWCASLGPTVASWGLLLWFVIRHGVRRGQRWAGDAAIAAVLVWLPLDFGLCFAFQFWPGMIIDPLVGLLMLGLLATIHPRLPLD